MTELSVLALELEDRMHERSRRCPGCTTGAVDERTYGMSCLSCWRRIPQPLRLDIVITSDHHRPLPLERERLKAAYQLRGWLHANQAEEAA